jgi:glycopeptide antibiotics resistance protein
LYLVAGVRDRGRAVLVGFLISLVIEITQAVIDIAWHGNRWADVNDLISNTVGAWLGFLIFWRAMRRARVARAVRGWSPARAEAAAAPAHRPVTWS